jgi:Fe-Mn family superoxide dismutase
MHLEPYIDARTMEIHHTKHHAAYITNLNNALAGTAMEGKKQEELMSVV